MQCVRWRAAAIAVAAGLSGIAHADNFNVAPGRLGEVAAALGLPAGVTIAVTEPDVANQYSPGVSGDLSLHDALGRVLYGTGAEAVFYDGTTIRIVRNHVPRPADEPRQAIAPPASAQPEEILV